MMELYGPPQTVDSSHFKEQESLKCSKMATRYVTGTSYAMIPRVNEFKPLHQCHRLQHTDAPLHTHQ